METYGWDTVFATTIEHANKALAASHDKLVSTFSFSAGGYQLDGTFGSWQIVPGGSGQLLHLQLPLQSGKMVDRSGKAFDISGLAVIVEVQLQLLSPTTDTSKQHLQFNFRTVGDKPGDKTPGVVTLIQVNDPAKRLPDQPRNILGHAIAECLVTNAPGISYIFGTINLVKPSANSWLTPVKSDYYYVQLEGAKPGYLAILSTTDNRDISTLERKIDPALLAGAGSGFFALSKEMFLRHIIQPTLPRVFQGTSDQAFKYNATNQSIQSTGWFATNAVKSGLIWYYPHVNSLLISVLDTSVVCSANGSCDMGLDITCTFGVHSQSALQYQNTTKSLSFARDPNPTVQHDYSIPWYDYFIPGITGIGDIILAIVVPLIADGIAGGLQQNAADLSLAKSPPQTIQWNGMSGFNVTAAGLNNCFYMRGELQ